MSKPETAVDLRARGDEPEGPARSLSGQAYEQILDLMLSGILPGGTPLRERKLAMQLGISRTPMREALARLESKGLIEKRTPRFLVVRQLSTREFVEALAVRKLLEAEAGRLAAGRVPKAQIARARAVVRNLKLSRTPTIAMMWAADDAVHSLIALHSGNTVLAESIRELRHRTHMFETHRLPDRLHDSCDEHLALLEALEKGQVSKVASILETHIDNVKESIIKRLSEP